MRKLYKAIYVFFFILPTNLVIAHGNLEEHLGHHWDNSNYIREIRLQFIIMAAVVAATIIWSLIRRKYTKKRV